MLSATHPQIAVQWHQKTHSFAFRSNINYVNSVVTVSLILHGYSAESVMCDCFEFMLCFFYSDTVVK